MSNPVDAFGDGIKILGSFLSSKKKRRARRLQAAANQVGKRASLLSNSIRRTRAAQSFLASVAEGKVASQDAGGTLRGSATQGQISGSRAAFAGAMQNSQVLERMGLRVNELNAASAQNLFKASQIQDIIGAFGQFQPGASEWWNSRPGGTSSGTETYAPPSGSGYRGGTSG